MTQQIAWPHLLADLKAKRDALTAIIAVVETQFIGQDGAPDLLTPAPRRTYARRAKSIATKPRASKTDGRTEQSAGQSRKQRGASLTT